MAPAIAADAKIPCPTPQHLKEELETLTWALEPEEKEDTWEKFERAILRFSAVTRGGGYKHTEQYVEGVGRSGIGKKIVKCMLSDRGRLSGVSTDLLQTFAPRLSTNFKPLVNLYLEPLVDLLGRPNKVFLKRAEKCLLTIITNCQIINILTELRRGLNDNSTTCRRGCSIGIEKSIKDWPIELWSDRYLVLLEECVKKMATDKDPEVRQTSRRVWALFMEYWPERVDNFSAPLTPTIRRYLELPAANGAGPSKPKPKAAVRPAPQAIRPISAASSESAHAPAPVPTSAVPARPQHHRVNALASRPVRPVHQPAPPPAVEAGPSRRRSPRKEPEYLPPAVETEEEDHNHPHPKLSRSASSTNQLHANDLAAPPVLGRHGRSVSHNVLPSSSSTFDEIKHNPLSKPSRPVLHPSHSVPVEAFQPARRFAPPARIMRVVPSEEEGGIDHGDHPFVTPSGATVLRGAQRNPNAGLGRRGNALGQAQRRVVTAPVTISEEGYFTKTPGRPMGGLGRKRYIEEDENNDTESPTKDHHIKENIPQAFASPIPTQVVSMDSPLMPILIRSASGDVKLEEDESDMIDMKEDVYPASPLRQKHEEEEETKIVEVARKIELPDSPVKAGKDLEPESPEASESHVEVVHSPEEGGGELVEEKQEREEEEESEEEEVEEVEYREVKKEDNSTNKTEQQQQTGVKVEQPVEVIDEAKETALVPVEEANGISHAEIPNRPQSKSTTTAATQVQPIPARLKPAVSAPSAKRPEETTKPAQVPTKPKVLAPTARKPPVPSARTATSRAVSAPVVRKAFKPTSLAAPTAASAARAANVAKPAPATTAVSKPSVATSTTAKMPTAGSSTAKSSTLNGPTSVKPSTAPTGTRARVVSAQIAPKPEPKHEPKVSTKPPLPPLSRAAPTQRVVSGPKKPAVTSHVTLPPIKKDRVTRKAPLPSFRPTRGAVPSGTASLKASTSSTTSASGRAKVKPEMIQLPESPSKPTEVPLPSSPHEIPIPHSPSSRAPSVLSSISRNTVKSSPLKIEIKARVRQDSIVSAPHSPIRMVPIKPLSPLLTTEIENVEIIPNPPVFALPSKQAEESSNVINLYQNSADPFVTTTITPISKSSNTTTEMGDESSDTEDSLDRITFKSKSLSLKSPSLKSNSENHDIVKNPKHAFGSRSDVSTPSSKAINLLSKLEGNEKGLNLAMSFTPPPEKERERERKALSVKNVNTPGTVGGEEDWDISI